jgi:hypothetical protein
VVPVALAVPVAATAVAQARPRATPQQVAQPAVQV